MAKSESVIGLVTSRMTAERLVSELQRSGFVGNDISVLFPDDRGSKDFAHEQHTKAPEGAATGASAGGVVGGTLGLLAGIGALAIPGVGPLIAAGPIMAALSGVAAGAIVGGLSGALIGLGIPEIEAKQYEGKLKEGNLLLSVHVDNTAERDRAKELLKEFGAYDIVTVDHARVPDPKRN